MNAVHAADTAQMGTQLFESAQMSAFRQQINIQIAQEGRKGIGIVDLENLAIGLFDHQTIGFILVQAHGEQAVTMDPLHHDLPCRHQDRDLGRLGLEGADDHAGLGPVRPQHGERIAMPPGGNGIGIGGAHQLDGIGHTPPLVNVRPQSFIAFGRKDKGRFRKAWVRSRNADARDRDQHHSMRDLTFAKSLNLVVD